MHDHEPSTVIIKRREEIRNELIQLLHATHSDAWIGEVEELIYEESGQEVFQSLVALFDTGHGAVELSTILEAITDAWNYFPHRSLNGRSPAEMSDDRSTTEDR